MILGHAATTLVAKRAAPDMPWWLLVISAFLIDTAMFSFVFTGGRSFSTGARLALYGLFGILPFAFLVI